MIPVTIQATRSGETWVMPGHGARQFQHVLGVPVGLCPRSGNPQPGATRPRTDPGPLVLEGVALHRLVTEGPNPARSSEGWVRHIADVCAEALGVEVRYRLDMVVEPGGQRLVVRGRSPCASS